MPLPRRRRVAAALCAALVLDAGLALVAGSAGAAVPASSNESVSAQDQEDNEPVATLEIIEPGVSVRKAGKERFKPATDGQNLKVGDTIQTDDTGFAQINYTDDGESFTRLDVNTTFTIESLTDEEGNRKIKGSLETGQTWNRTSSLTENETFEQEGAGATAAVTGTAFLVTCVDALNCTFTSIIDGIQLTTVDGEVQTLDPLEVCGSTEITEEDANLCAAVEQANLDAILANGWILENLFLDGVAGFEGIIVVEDGEVVSFTETTPPPEEEEEDTPPSGPPANAAPVVSSNPVSIVTDDGQTPNRVLAGNSTTIVTSQDELNTTGSPVTFMLQVTDAEGDPYWIVFTDLPAPQFGRLLYDAGNAGDLDPVLVNTSYASNVVYTFDPVQFEPTCNGTNLVMSDCFTNGNAESQFGPDDPLQTGGAQPYPSTPFDNGDGTVRWQDTFTFKAVQQDTLSESAPATVPVEAVEDMCNPGNEGSRTANDVVPSCNP